MHVVSASIIRDKRTCRNDGSGTVWTRVRAQRHADVRREVIRQRANWLIEVDQHAVVTLEERDDARARIATTVVISVHGCVGVEVRTVVWAGPDAIQGEGAVVVGHWAIVVWQPSETEQNGDRRRRHKRRNFLTSDIPTRLSEVGSRRKILVSVAIVTTQFSIPLDKELTGIRRRDDDSQIVHFDTWHSAWVCDLRIHPHADLPTHAAVVTNWASILRNQFADCLGELVAAGKRAVSVFGRERLDRQLHVAALHVRISLPVSHRGICCRPQANHKDRECCAPTFSSAKNRLGNAK